METIAFLGASRGLGRAVAERWADKTPNDRLLLFSRTQSLNLGESYEFDFSKAERVGELAEVLIKESITRIFYFAAGGPFGPFADKAWKDHQWALQVSFLTPMQLLHEMLRSKPEGLRQFIVVGSQVADDKPDPLAASYAAAKHGLRGLIGSVRAEQPSNLDLRLFRPGYMDTGLLPPKAKPRIMGEPLVSAAKAAEVFVAWAKDPFGEPLKDL